MVLWRRYFYGVSEQISVLLLPHLNPCHPFHCQITKRLFLAPWFGHRSKNYQNKSCYATDLQQRTLFHISHFLKNPFIDLSKVMKLSPLNMNCNMIYPITLEWAWDQYISIYHSSSALKYNMYSLYCKQKLLCGYSLPVHPTIEMDKGKFLPWTWSRKYLRHQCL